MSYVKKAAKYAAPFIVGFIAGQVVESHTGWIYRAQIAVGLTKPTP